MYSTFMQSILVCLIVDGELVRVEGPTYYKTAKGSLHRFPENYVPPQVINKLTLTSQQNP